MCVCVSVCVWSVVGVALVCVWMGVSPWVCQNNGFGLKKMKKRQENRFWYERFCNGFLYNDVTAMFNLMLLPSQIEKNIILKSIILKILH